MPFVTIPPEDQVSPEVKERYEKIRKAMGFVPNALQAAARTLPMLDAQLALGNATVGDGALPRTLKEQIGMVVSGLNTSSYCVALHMEILRQFGVEKALSKKLAVDYPNAPVGEREKALFRFADKLTKHPDDIEEADVAELKKHGWGEDALWELVMTVSFFNYVNRAAIGLGLVAEF